MLDTESGSGSRHRTPPARPRRRMTRPPRARYRARGCSHAVAVRLPPRPASNERRRCRARRALVLGRSGSKVRARGRAGPIESTDGKHTCALQHRWAPSPAPSQSASPPGQRRRPQRACHAGRLERAPGQRDRARGLGCLVGHLDLERVERALCLAQEDVESSPCPARLIADALCVSPDSVAVLVHVFEARDLGFDAGPDVIQSSDVA